MPSNSKGLATTIIVLSFLALIIIGIIYNFFLNKSNVVELFVSTDFVHPDKGTYNFNDNITAQATLVTSLAASQEDPETVELDFKNTNFIVYTDLEVEDVYVIAYNDKIADKLQELYKAGKRQDVRVGNYFSADSFSIKENTFKPIDFKKEETNAFNFKIDGKYDMVYFIVKGKIPIGISGNINLLEIQEKGYDKNGVKTLNLYKKSIHAGKASINDSNAKILEDAKSRVEYTIICGTKICTENPATNEDLNIAVDLSKAFADYNLEKTSVCYYTNLELDNNILKSEVIELNNNEVNAGCIDNVKETYDDLGSFTLLVRGKSTDGKIQLNVLISPVISGNIKDKITNSQTKQLLSIRKWKK